MMRTALRWVLDRIYDEVVAAGFDDLGRAHVGMFRYPTMDGMRPSDLADLLQITKQSVNDLLRDLEARGYVTREPHPSDGRARVIRLTKRGHAVEAVAYQAATSCQQTIADLLGERRFSQFRQSLEEIVNHIADGDLEVADVRQ